MGAKNRHQRMTMVSPFIWFSLLILLSSIVLGLSITTSQSSHDPRAGAVYSLPPGNGVNPIVLPVITQTPTPTFVRIPYPKTYPGCCYSRPLEWIDYCLTYGAQIHAEYCSEIPSSPFQK